MSSSKKSSDTQQPKFARTRFRQASELLASIFPLTDPADTMMDRYFKAHREMGSQDRGFAAETTYACLRRLRELRALCRGAGPFPGLRFEAEAIVATYLITVGGWSMRGLEETDFKDRAEALIKTVRPHQWIKNIFVAAALVTLTVVGAVLPFAVTAAVLGVPAWLLLRRRHSPSLTPRGDALDSSFDVAGP